MTLAIGDMKGEPMKHFRIGQIVPSSNTTMETEIPAMLTSRYSLFPEERFTFHSSRMRMMHVSPEELKRWTSTATVARWN